MRARTLLPRHSARRIRLLLVLSALAVPCALPAQVTTGKVQGRVTDSADGSPLALATVRIQGTTLANVTNAEGFYFINEVPAGLHEVEASFLGHRAMTIADQRILAGQTTTLNFELERSAIELQPLVVEGVRNPLVPRDQVVSKAIVQGQTVDLLPVDNVSSIVVLQPGVYEELGCADERGPDPTGCVSIRGGRPNEEAVYVDGVLARSFGTGRAANVAVPTNSLEQLDVTVGAFAAEFGEAQSGVISYVTRRGGARYTGAAQYSTDRLGPDNWYTGFHRLELNIGGPIVGPLTFFLAGTGTGQDWYRNEGMPDFYVIDGVDTCPDDPQFRGLCTAGEPAVFRSPRVSTTSGATDFVDVAAPRFVPWEDGRTVPRNYSDELLFTGNLSYQLPRGSRVNFAYTRNRYQNYYSVGSWWSQYRFESTDGDRDTRDLVALSGFFTLAQSATQQLALDVRASYQASRFRGGAVDYRWFLDHRDPFLGFTASDVEFVGDEDLRRYGLDMFHPGEELIRAWRSDAIAPDSLSVFPGSDVGSARQSLPGITTNLRYNPWAWYYGYYISGEGFGGFSVRDEDIWQFRATLDWQLGRFNRLKAGGEYLSVNLSRMEMPLGGQGFGRPGLAQPSRAGLYVQDRLDVGDLVLEGGLRWDFFDPDSEYSVYPGYEQNVPDSLQAGYVRWSAEEQAFVPKFDEPCGGVTPQNPNGTCLENFVPMTTKSELSPRLGASFPVTPTSTFRLSYGRFVQAPAFFSSSGYNWEANAAASQVDLLGPQARDVDMPSTTTFEFGYRQLVGQDLVIDVAAFNKKQREGLTYRSVESVNPNDGRPEYVSVLTNADFTESNGFELSVDKAVGNLFIGSLSYSYLDAQGTGTDPWTYEDLIATQRTNLSFLTGEPVNPPEVLLPLELGRRHNLSLTTSLVFPSDYLAGSTAGAILRDLGLFVLLSVRSGQRYTGLVYEGGYGTLGPPSASGQVETSIAALETPWQTHLDLRLSKGFPIGKGWQIQAFIDWRNPFDIQVTEQIFLDTGNPVNEAARERWLNDALADPRLDGDPDIDDFDIALESPETDFNKYMLMRAEQRWGDGDGVFTVEEQVRSFEPDWEQRGGIAALTPSNQNLRLGLRVSF